MVPWEEDTSVSGEGQCSVLYIKMDAYHTAHWSSDPSYYSCSSEEEEDNRYRITHHQRTKQRGNRQQQRSPDSWTWEEILDGKGNWVHPGESGAARAARQSGAARAVRQSGAARAFRQSGAARAVRQPGAARIALHSGAAGVSRLPVLPESPVRPVQPESHVHSGPRGGERLWWSGVHVPCQSRHRGQTPTQTLPYRFRFCGRSPHLWFSIRGSCQSLSLIENHT
ncbi:uncharacterized protein LOC115108639 isoform X1 [Oncorhynchus nerka]|uniref:uncharacterized protein LOC115108639 isoform X1 n=1 Tax=Oncorhynchus nerka TaxID=8023 RepID=UPI0031B86769